MGSLFRRRNGCVKMYSNVVECTFLVCVLYPRARAPTNVVQQLNYTHCLHHRKVLELCRSCAQNQVRNAHPQRISWLLVAVSNAILIALHAALGWLKKEEITILIFGRFRFATLN